MLAYRNPSNEDSDSIFNYTLKLDAYLLIMWMQKICDLYNVSKTIVFGAFLFLGKCQNSKVLALH